MPHLNQQQRAELNQLTGESVRLGAIPDPDEPNIAPLGRYIMALRHAVQMPMGSNPRLLKSGVAPSGATDEQRRLFTDHYVVALAKAAVGAADSTNTANLVTEVLGTVIDALRPLSVLANIRGAVDIAMTWRDLEVFHPIVATDMTTAGFVAENGVIPVGQATFAGVTMGPLRKCAGIVAATEELFNRSDAANVLQRVLLSAIARAVEAQFLSANAPTTAAPAGLWHVSNAVAPIAGTASAITDLKALWSALAAADLDPMQATWIMHPTTFMALATLLVGGVKVFPETGGGLLMGIPVLTSTLAPLDDVGLLHGPSLYRAYDLDAIDFSVSADTSLHMSDTPAEVGGASTPVRSLFQTVCKAVRGALWTTWRVTRPAASQRATTVGWN